MIRLAPDLILPDKIITEALAILAVRGAGKSNVAAVMVEEFDAAGFPWIVIDPKGDWYGVRAGKGALKVPIFGGLHGDLPLDPAAGTMMAELVHDRNLPCLLDVSEFDSKGEQTRFLTAFGERLFRLQGRSRVARHVVLEEADEIVPQKVYAQMARCVGIWTKVVKQGRQRGLGITLVSQRSAVVNKDALTQIEVLIVLRTTSPQDRKAIEGWVQQHAVSADLLASLPELSDGEAWVCSPHLLGVVDRFQIRRRRTFDSGATPELDAAGGRRASLADIDLGALRSEMADTIERAKADDPAELRKRIAALERELSGVTASVERVEVPVVPPKLAELIRGAQEEFIAAQDRIGELAREQTMMLGAASGKLGEAVRTIKGLPEREFGDDVVARGGAESRPVAAAPRATRRDEGRMLPPARNGAASSLPKAQRAVLSVLAQFPDGRTKRQLAMLTGYSASGGGFNNALSALRNAEPEAMINTGEPIRILPAGETAIDGHYEPLPTGRALLEHWLGQVGKAERLILEVLADAGVASKEGLATSTGYAANGGGFNNALSRLRTLQLIEGRGEIRLSDELAEAIA